MICQKVNHLNITNNVVSKNPNILYFLLDNYIYINNKNIH